MKRSELRAGDFYTFQGKTDMLMATTAIRTGSYRDPIFAMGACCGAWDVLACDNVTLCDPPEWFQERWVPRINESTSALERITRMRETVTGLASRVTAAKEPNARAWLIVAATALANVTDALVKSESDRAKPPPPTSIPSGGLGCSAAT